MNGEYVPVRLRFNIGHLVGYVSADQLDELLAAATDTGYVTTTLLVVERLSVDAMPSMDPQAVL